MFETVQNELAKGKCLGIFPEGGSHDRTDLLPLKVGVAAIAFGVLEKHDRNVPIVPVGLNYFRGHRFRGRVVVEFGEPVQIDKETLSVYKKSKRLGYQALLSKVEEGMRSVIVTAPNYNELKLIHTVRRVYQRTPSAMMPSNPTKYRQDMARRMSVGYQLLKDKYNGEEYLPQEVLDLKKRFEDYQDTLEQWGIRDYQVNQLDVPFNTLLYTFMHAFIVILLASIPTLILNAPVGLLASYYASKQAKKDLKASRVKLAARDVLMSKKIVFSLVAVPVLWISYAVLMLLFTNWEPRTILVLLLLCPYFAYIGATGLGMGMVDVKDLKPALLRLLPAFQRVVKTLPGTRAQLQKDVRIMMKKYGPSLGAVYHDKSDGWEKRVQLPCSSSDANLEETGRCVSNEGEAAEGTTEHMREPSTEYVEDVRTRSGSTISNHCDLEDTADMLNFSTGVSVDLPLEGEIGRIHNEHEVESISDLDHVVDELINQGSKKDN